MAEPPAELFELKQEDLHHYWESLLQRGVADIKRDMKPNWLPEDIFSALRQQQVSCVIARRAERLLGFLIYSKQLRIFNYQPELFVWCAWNLPLKEWLPTDDMPAVVTQVWTYVANVAKSQYGTTEITWITRPGRAKAFGRRFGWQPAWVTMTAKV
jgi:hypothetical protein